MYVKNGNTMQALNCLETTEEFKELSEECQERCFLALRRLQREKVRYPFKRYNVYTHTTRSYYNYLFGCSVKYIAVHTSRMPSTKIIESTSI